MGTGDKHRKNSDDGRGVAQHQHHTSSSVNELTKQAHRRLQKGDLQGAMEHYEQAVQEAKSSSDPTVKISSYLNAGACLVSLGHYRRGLDLLELACKILKKSGVTTTTREEASEVDRIACRSSPTSSKPKDTHLFEMSADVHFNAAVAAQGLQDFEKATLSFKICIDHYLKAGAKNHTAEGFSALAGCYREAGQLDEEISSLVSAQQLYSELEDFSNEAMTCMDLAKVYLRVGKKDECKRMITTAKLQAMRVDNSRILGKLHSQFGLLYTTLGLFEDAIGNFEKALPLVRSGARSANSLQVEASLLQNIGAAYNELERYFDAVVYHREAAVLHGKTKNLISESKCLCNLAFAQAQLKDYPEAAKNFSNALAKAHKARNNYLQFQACEGLGAINFHMGRYGEAVSYFKQALGILDEIKQETGIPRERVMEKLSDAEEALQKMKAKQSQRDFSRFHDHLQNGGGGGGHSIVTGTPGSSSDESASVHGKCSPRIINRRLSPEFERVSRETDGHSGAGTEKRLSLQDRRGVTFLAPIESQSTNPQPSRKHAVPRKRNSDKNDHHHHHHFPPVNDGRRDDDDGYARDTSTKLNRHDSLDAEVRDYINSYKDRDSQAENSTDSESDGGLVQLDAKHARRDSGDQLGSSVFSRHAPGGRNGHFSGSPESLQGVRRGSSSSPRYEPVTEGCLALGQNTRELYTTQTRVVKQGRKKRTMIDIVPKTPVQVNSGVSSPGHTSSNPPQPQTQPTSKTSSTQSKICVIL